jgi:uncharacterized protein
MVNDMFIHEYSQLKPNQAMAIIGFPSVGLVSSIAANFIARTMKLDLIAAVISDEFPPYTIIHDGAVAPPVRIYAGKRTCNEKGENCEQLVLITAEFMPTPNLLRPLVQLILEWCKKNDVNKIVALEGINVGDNPEQKEILAVATGENCRAMLQTYGIKEMKEGMVSGTSGVLLYEADRLGRDVICLLGPARSEYPDARGAARLLEYVTKMIPELKLDPDPLFKEAEQMEKEMKTTMEGIRQTTKRGDESLLYG